MAFAPGAVEYPSWQSFFSVHGIIIHQVQVVESIWVFRESNSSSNNPSADDNNKCSGPGVPRRQYLEFVQ